ncbi:MAG: hypothetical protein HY832_02380 [Candidatus Aenigmarchaeota archaeon]|nr:hypothetical protein [Candidatus Aenigmarchaeota archaeon]
MDTQKRLLEQASFNPDNKQLIKEFMDSCAADSNISDPTILKYCFNLRNIAALTTKHFKDLDEKDFVSIIARIREHRTPHGNPYTEQSMQGYIKAISKFWRWLYRDTYFGEAPPHIRIVRGLKRNCHKEPHIFSKEDIQKILNEKRQYNSLRNNTRI